jgi:hypothetical protein
MSWYPVRAWIFIDMEVPTERNEDFEIDMAEKAVREYFAGRFRDGRVQGLTVRARRQRLDLHESPPDDTPEPRSGSETDAVE